VMYALTASLQKHGLFGRICLHTSWSCRCSCYFSGAFFSCVDFSNVKGCWSSRGV